MKLLLAEVEQAYGGAALLRSGRLWVIPAPGQLVSSVRMRTIQYLSLDAAVHIRYSAEVVKPPRAVLRSYSASLTDQQAVFYFRSRHVCPEMG